MGDLRRHAEEAIWRDAEVVGPREVADDDVARRFVLEQLCADAHRNGFPLLHDRVLGVESVDEVVVAEKGSVIERRQRLPAVLSLAGDPNRVASVLVRRELCAIELPVEPMAERLFHRGVEGGPGEIVARASVAGSDRVDTKDRGGGRCRD
jgi:hypothetical protein